jgi:hypothetical protein
MPTMINLFYSDIYLGINNTELQFYNQVSASTKSEKKSVERAWSHLKPNFGEFLWVFKDKQPKV